MYALSYFGQIHSWRAWEDEAYMDQYNSLHGKLRLAMNSNK